MNISKRILYYVIILFILLPLLFSCENGGYGYKDRDPNIPDDPDDTVLPVSHLGLPISPAISAVSHDMGNYRVGVGGIKYCEKCGASETDNNRVDFKVENIWRKIGYEGFDDSGSVKPEGTPNIKPGIRIIQNGINTHRYVLNRNAVVTGTPAISGFGNGTPINSVYQMQKIREAAATMDMNFQKYDDSATLSAFRKLSEDARYNDYYYISAGNKNAVVKFVINIYSGSYWLFIYWGNISNSVDFSGKYYFIAIDSNDTGYLCMNGDISFTRDSSGNERKFDLGSGFTGSAYDKYVIPEKNITGGGSFITGIGLVSSPPDIDKRLDYLFRLSMPVQ